jgi:hypothetical protein
MASTPDKDKPKKSAAAMWGEELEWSDAPIDGIDRETLRKAMALNPAMKKQEGSTQRVIEKLEKANQARPVNERADATAALATMNLVDGVDHLKKRFYEDQQRLKAELDRVQKAIRDLVPATQEKLVGLFVSHDPNMSNPMTNELLKVEGKFLNEVQFSVRKVIEAQQKKRR